MKLTGQLKEHLIKNGMGLHSSMEEFEKVLETFEEECGEELFETEDVIDLFFKFQVFCRKKEMN